MFWWCLDDVLMTFRWCYDGFWFEHSVNHIDDVLMTSWWLCDGLLMTVWWLCDACRDGLLMVVEWCAFGWNVSWWHFAWCLANLTETSMVGTIGQRSRAWLHMTYAMSLSGWRLPDRRRHVRPSTLRKSRDQCWHHTGRPSRRWREQWQWRPTRTLVTCEGLTMGARTDRPAPCD